ncbi:hypothetical protein T4D_3521 [Trichinella pseudospiralis]|uniref:Uncharacterized protein n=1 Tax=Trichinella pseudospiralis TaxID=6337 RepID=A0A0V1FNU1_TRIPS|nr:hypothetical protein T4D_3521 [Trichinella pseudospiralis]
MSHSFSCTSYQHTIVHVQGGAVEAADVRENGQSVEKANQPVQPECGRDHKHHRQPSTAPYAIVRPVPFARTIHHVREAEFGRIAPLATLEQQLVIHAADQCRAERHDENVLDQFQHVGQDNATQTLTLVVLVDVEEKFVQIIYMLPSAASILGRHDHLVRLERKWAVAIVSARQLGKDRCCPSSCTATLYNHSALPNRFLLTSVHQ